jgi:protein TonB
MHDHRAMRPATGRLINRPDRRFMAAALGALAINAAVAIGLVTLTTSVPPLNRPIRPLVVALLDPPAPAAPTDPPPPPPSPSPPIKPPPSLAFAPQVRPAQAPPAEAKRPAVSIAGPAAASPPAAASAPASAPSTPAPSTPAPSTPAPVTPAPEAPAAPAPPAANAIAAPPPSASTPSPDASATASTPSTRQAPAAGSSGASATARRTGPRVDASWAGNSAPGYPSSARRMGEQGQVRLDVHVGADGMVIDVQLRESSGSAALDRSAMEAVRKWRFRPATVDGQPVAEWYRNWEWIFRLEG